MEFLFSAEGMVALLTLTVLEIVLGIDNIIFISILVGRLPEHRRARARFIGLALALVLRIAFLAAASWMASLVTPLFTIQPVMGMQEAFAVAGRDLIMFAGGLFLLGKATTELYSKLEDEEEPEEGSRTERRKFGWLIFQIVILDVVFSIDSVITAIGMTTHIEVMIVAVVIAVGVMILSSGGISRFIHKHPSVKVLALAFLLMVGMVLVVEGFHVHIPKGYVYFAMAFSVLVEAMNIRIRRKRRKSAPVELRSPQYKE